MSDVKKELNDLNAHYEKYKAAKDIQAKLVVYKQIVELVDTLSHPDTDGNSKTQTQEYGDVIVSNENNEILLVQRTTSDDFMPNKWWIPGGKIDEGETPSEGASRELLEETGIKVVPAKLKFIEKKSLKSGGISHRFSASLPSNAKIKLQKNELQSHAWVSIDDLKDYDLLGALSALKFLIEPSVLDANNAMLDLPPVDRSTIATPTTQSTRQKANDAAIELLERIKSAGLNRSDLTDDEIETLAKYTGNGGGLTNKEGLRGSAYEYYTPTEIAAGMWDLAKELGFNGGKVLDPSSGTGIFTATSPDNAIVDSVELDETSGSIAKILNDGNRSHTAINPFEKEAKRIPDDSLDMVITNVPFGDKSARGANRFEDKAYQDESLQNYFILRSLEKLKPNGLAIFITPTSVIDGITSSAVKLRQKAALKADFLGAYRLPTEVFKSTGAEVVTDIIVFRKFPLDVSEKVKDLYDTGGIDTLKEAGILWDEFLKGRYFKSDERIRNFVLGSVTTKKNKFGKETGTVIVDPKKGGIPKLLRKFGDSRIDWDALNAAEPDFIEYKNGDTVFQNGKQLAYKDGVWEVTEKEVTDTDRRMQDLLTGMGNSHQIIVSGVTWDDVLDVQDYMGRTGQRGLIPSNVEQLIKKTVDSRVAKNSMPAAWRAIALADAIDHSVAENGYDGFNYKASEPALTKAMKPIHLDGKNSGLKGDAATALKLIGLHYNKGAYSNVWLGEVHTEVQSSAGSENYKNKLARLQYENKSLHLTPKQLKEIHPDVDPLTDDDWFVSSDGGRVIHADDFLIGTLADRLTDIDKQIESASDDAIKAKLIRQKAVARSKVEPIDFKKMQYDLRSPLIDAETKVKFLKQFVNVGAFVDYDEHGKGTADIDTNSKNDTDKLYNRIGDWISKGTVTLGGVKLKQMSDREALDWLAERINKANVEFNAWVKSNNVLMDSLDKRGNAPENLYFSQNADDSPIDIAGMNPDLSLHGYQNEFVRKQGRMFGGINGMGVGLGKAQPLTAKILTPQGWRLMGDMKVGDEVYAFDGTVTKVNGVFPQGEKDIFEVVFSDGAKTQCCNEHLWQTSTKHSSGVKSLSKIRETLNLEHYIPMVWHCGSLGRENVELPIEPRILGMFLAGKHHLSDNAIKLSGLELQYDPKNTSIPELYMHSSHFQRHMLLAGILDGTAQINFGSGDLFAVIKSKKLAHDTVALIRSVGGTAELITNNNKYKVEFCLPFDLGYVNNEWSDDAKALIVPKHPKRIFNEINPIGKAQAQCISIDHSSHLYITDDYIVTHNTFTALASVQHVQNIGAKKKTIFVLPNSVLSNWRKEAQFAYENTDDCLFVGLREKDGKFKVYSSKYDEDLLQAIDGKYRKIFMTFEAFRRIRLKDNSIEGYATYLQRTDSAYEHKELKKDDEKAKGLVAELIDNIKINSSAPYLEDMNVDSVVVDEAHAFKNSITAPKTNARVKYLSLAPKSDRGEDAQAKLWYVRSKSQNRDGVQLLSATPITNSPLEIYSMLALAGGRETVNSMAGGVKGADEFLQIMCQVEEEVVPTIDGKERSQNVFTGIRNVQVLRQAIKATATIKEAKDVGLSVVIPEREETATKVTLSDDATAMLETYQLAYQMAKALVKADGGKPELPDDEQLKLKMTTAYNEVQSLFNEDEDLMGHPFNLIRKMDVLIADDDFSKQATFYDFDKGQKQIAQKVVDAFNKKSPSDERPRLSVFTNPEDAKEIYCKDGDTKELVGYKIKVRAKIVLDSGRERIVIDTLNGNVQSNFEDLAEKSKLELDVTVSAKIAAMLDNFKAEASSPRGVNSDGTNSSIVKQIIFCDHIFLHNKIKKLLAKQAGVPANKIAIITGQTNNEPDEMIDIQDGFNAETDDNHYQVIIANQKAEVGINLQKGTQAIHHLTTGWTPDSLEQRNGRGARQGNKTDKVTIYHYDADGTFDEFKRTMINKKDEWISNLLSSDDKNTVAVSGGISKEDKEALIAIGSDKDAIARYQAEKDDKEAQIREESTKRRQKINIGIIEEQAAYLKTLSEKSLCEKDVKTVIDIVRANAANLKQSFDSKVTENQREKASKKYAQAKQAAIDKLNTIINSVDIQITNYATDEIEHRDVTITADALYSKIEGNRTDFKPGDRETRTSRSDSWFSKFEKLLSGNEETSGSIVVRDDSGYQSDYDDAKITAENMIEQSIKAVDEIAKDSGGLPVGAGKKIADGLAKMNNGEYIEVGAIVVYENNALSVFNDDLRPYRLSKSGINNAGMPTDSDKVVLPSDANYISHVKRLASDEDELYDLGQLEEPFYSDVIPAVADYRDASIIPSISLPYSLSYTKLDKLTNGPLPYLLPKKVLINDTPFAKTIKADYERAGIAFDLDNGKFGKYKISKDGPASIEGVIEVSGAEGSAQVADNIADYIKAHNIKIENGDKLIEVVGGILIKKLIKVTKSDVNKKISEAMDQVVQKLLAEDIKPDLTRYREEANIIANEYIIKDSYMASELEISDKYMLLGGFVDTEQVEENKSGEFHIRKRYENALEKKNSLDRKESGENAESSAIDNNTNFHPNDLIAITGEEKDTKYWKKEIKDYAAKHGSPVSGNRYYKWDGKNVQWLVRYDGYAKFIEDYPKAAEVLTIEKV